MAAARIEPSGLSFAVAPGETLFKAAAQAGLRWPNVCGGNGLCRTCWFEVIRGTESLGPVHAAEADALRSLAGTVAGDAVRLACQAKVLGDLTVRKVGLRPVAAGAPLDREI